MEQRQYSKEYYLLNKEKILASAKVYRETHQAEAKIYRETHKDESKAYRETHLEQSKSYRELNKEDLSKKGKERIKCPFCSQRVNKGSLWHHRRIRPACKEFHLARRNAK